MDMSVKLGQVYPSTLPPAPVADRDPLVPAKVQEAAAPEKKQPHSLLPVALWEPNRFRKM